MSSFKERTDANVPENLSRLSEEEIDLWLNYLLAQENIRSGSQEQVVERPQQSSQTAPPRKPVPSGSPLEEVREPFERAYFSYARLLHDTTWNTQERCDRASTTYMTNSWADGPEQRHGDIHITYAQTIQEAHMDAHREFAQEYSRYLQALQDAWSRMNIDAVDPGSLLAISNSMAMAAFSASRTTGNRWTWATNERF